MTPVAKNRYFTLIELLSVMAIIIILAGILIGGLGHASKKADVAKTISLMTQLEMALDDFNDQYGYYPRTYDGDTAEAKDVYFDVDGSNVLQLKLGGKDKTGISFIKKGTKNRPLIEIGTEGFWEDAWENPFRYQYPGTNNSTSYDLWSNGLNENFDSDGKTTNDTDDINNWSQH